MLKKAIGCIFSTCFVCANANAEVCNDIETSEYVECTCFTPPFYDLQCDFGLFVTVDFLYWYSKDANLVFAQKTKSDLIEEAQSFLIQPAYYNMPTKICHVDEKWDPGFRIGLGYNTTCDGWDFYLNWTYFSNESKNSESVNSLENGVENDLLLNPWANPIFGSDFHFDPFDLAFFEYAPIYTQVDAEWKEKINIIDFEIGRKYWLSRCMSMRPFIGIRGAWDRNRFEVFSQLENRFMGIVSTNEVKFENKFWGVGIIVGFQPTWYFTRCFSLFGSADVSLIWGKSEIERDEDIAFRLLELTNAPIHIPKAQDDTSIMQPILDLAIGLRYESNFCCNRYHAALDVGWEQHVWFNHNRRFQLRDGFGGLSRDSGFSELGFISAGLDEVCGDLVFGGLIIKFRFDF